MDERISKVVMEQFEKVRQGGKVNMFDYFRVIRAADIMACYDLATLTRADYLYLLTNFNRLLGLYQIEQEV